MLESWIHQDSQDSMADCPLSTQVAPRRCPFIPVPSSVTAITTTMSSTLCPVVSSPMTNGTISSISSPVGSAWDTLRSPDCSDQDLVSAAAHLHLLGESLSLIGQHLQVTNKSVCVSSSLSLLLDSLLCALPPLICLTSQIPELRSCTQHTLSTTLENISYVMPGL
ncbi:HMG box-containing protein 4-like [Scomber japonicus]|uniref:HMG box-containing protein 4-like n=1 Tax=Scomber japonicus TaxID=13676 RepID=UPI0023060423|nr:HMG box-containing protein 4-like [Scomber japonicus]